MALTVIDTVSGKETVIHRIKLPDLTMEEVSQIMENAVNKEKPFRIKNSYKTSKWGCGNKMQAVSKNALEDFISKYPRELKHDFFMDWHTWNDFSLGSWPQSVVTRQSELQYDGDQTVCEIISGGTQ